MSRTNELKIKFSQYETLETSNKQGQKSWILIIYQNKREWNTSKFKVENFIPDINRNPQMIQQHLN